jgi:PAS domain S-box-containing protein
VIVEPRDEGVDRDAAAGADALAQAVRRCEEILESINDPFLALDAEWRFVYLNDRALDLLGAVRGAPATRGDLIGRTVRDAVPQLLDHPATESNFRRAFRDRTSIVYDRLELAGGRRFEVNLHPTETGLSVHYRDVTERARADEDRNRWARQQALLAELGQRALAGERLQAIMDDAVSIVTDMLETAPVGIAELLPGEELLLLRAGAGWRPGAVGTATGQAGRRSLVGYTAMSREPVVSEDMRADERFTISAFVAEHKPVSVAAVPIEGRDRPFGVLEAFSRQRRSFSADDVTFLQSVANVISSATERVAAERRVLQVRDAERRRIARDLHDEALQDLVDALAVASAPGAAQPDASVARLAPALSRAAEHVRNAIYDLRLAGDGERVFLDLLGELVELQRKVWAGGTLELDVHTTAPEGPLGYVGTEVLRVVREALVNARRHAGARTVRVSASGAAGALRVEVTDDGDGFDTSSPTTTGIAGMRERIALLGGRLELGSAPGAGTRVSLAVPLSGSRAPADTRVRVVLIEDHTAVREAIAAMFAREPDFRVVGQAATMAEAGPMLHGDVDVAVIDLGLPDGFGGDLIGDLHRSNPRAHALVLTASLDRTDMARAVERGAAGTLDKAARLDEVVDAVRRLRAGENLMPIDEMAHLLAFARRRRTEEFDDRQAIDTLTARELEVLQALADGLDSQAVADRLRVTIRTERNHVANILAKLGVHSRLQALVFALRYDLVRIH